MKRGESTVSDQIVAYVDSSVVLRWILREPDPVLKVQRYERLYVSRLVRFECVRTLQRLFLESKIGETEYNTRLSELSTLEKMLSVVSLRERKFRSAEQFFPLHSFLEILLKRQKSKYLLTTNSSHGAH